MVSTEGFPELLVEGAELSLLSKEPDINTPTGVQIDDQNNIWVIENHTHVRQEDYPGPKVDRILVFSGYLDESKEQTITEFATDFVDGMSLSFTPDGNILITTRASVMKFSDTDGDMVADLRDTLISLQTEEKFPHNGMSGLVVGPDGKLYFQCGENFGAYYELSGTDGITLYGKEREGGSLYRCHMDGSGLERIGTAVWNCFAMNFDDYGNLFAVENDPDSRPPCRLLHIVRGGNYGFQFQHGRDGLSPLTSWFGQIPGTLPMVAGTGEAPCAVMYYDQDHFGSEANGSLMVTGWGDNDIQYFPLKKQGSSFTAESRPFMKGDRNFYPVGLATDNEGGIVATDWASVSYAVHGKGRIWKISNPDKAQKHPRDTQTKDGLMAMLNSKDRRVRAAAAKVIVRDRASELGSFFSSSELSDPGKMNLLWAASLAENGELPTLLKKALTSDNELVRAAVVRMMVDQQLQPKEEFYVHLIRQDASSFVKREAIYGLRSESAFQFVVGLFDEEDPFIHTAIIESFGKAEHVDFLMTAARSRQASTRLGALLCLRKSGSDQVTSMIPSFLNDADTDIRLTALKWVAEDHLTTFRDEVESSFSKLKDISGELFDAYVVTFQYLDGRFNARKHFMEGDDHVSRSFYKRQKFLMATAGNPNLNFDIRTRALAGINPNHEDLKVETLIEYSNSRNASFQIEALRSLREHTTEEAVNRLQEVAKRKRAKREVRLEAIVGLAKSASTNENSRKILLDIAQKGNDELKAEAARSLEILSNEPEVQTILEAYRASMPAAEEGGSPAYWANLGRKEGNAVAGARTFFNVKYQCSNCHRIDGRGGIFGPDLSKVGSNANKDRIVESILDPSAVVSPTYSGYSVLTEDGKTTVGRLDKDLDSKRHLQMILINGDRAAVAYNEIVEQELLAQSLMPMNLHRLMTAQEFQDLIQFLSDQK